MSESFAVSAGSRLLKSSFNRQEDKRPSERRSSPGESKRPSLMEGNVKDAPGTRQNCEHALV